MTNPPSSRRRRIILGFIALAVVGGAVPVLYNQPFFRPYPKRFKVVDDHILYRSAQPTPRQLQRLVDEYGIRTLLIVREGDAPVVSDEVSFAREHGLNVVHVPIQSREEIPEDQVRQFFECVDAPANRPILIHCSAGRHRTGYLCALYRIERQGWAVERAMNEMLSFGFETDRQQAVLDQLKRHAARPPSPTTAASPLGCKNVKPGSGSLAYASSASRLSITQGNRMLLIRAAPVRKRFPPKWNQPLPYGRGSDQERPLSGFCRNTRSPCSITLSAVPRGVLIAAIATPVLAESPRLLGQDMHERFRGMGETPVDPVWVLVGLMAQGVIFLCFVIHLISSRHRPGLVIPSFVGFVGLLATLALMIYASLHRDVVFMIGQFVNTLIVLRLLVVSRRPPEAPRPREKAPAEQPSGFPVVAPHSVDRKPPPTP